MRRVCILLLLFMLIVSCSTSPLISPVKPLELTKIQDKCNGVFPIGKWRFVHTIEATLPDGKKAFMMGVTQIYPEKKNIHCIMMTIEGLVVFDGLYDGKIVINRGVPPFASDNFAKGLISDLQLIFFQPEALRIETGVSDTNEWICRYHIDEESTVDVVIHFDNSWTLRRYRHRRLRRTVQAYLGQDSDLHYKNKIPERMELIAREGHGYSLNLKLVKAEPVAE